MRHDPQVAYNRWRFGAVVCLLALNSSCALASTVHHTYSLAFAAVLFLIPPLLRELDLKHGHAAHRLSAFEWSCFVAGTIFLIVLPIVLF